MEWYNKEMNLFHFYTSIQIRYGDLDPQWHVNNSRFNSFIEQARFDYLVKLGLFDGRSYFDLGIIVADVHMVYLLPITMQDRVRVGIRVARIGNKSLTFEYQIEDETGERIFARAETVMVSYDYHQNQSVPVPDNWREKIAAFEGIAPRS